MQRTTGNGSVVSPGPNAPMIAASLLVSKRVAIVRYVFQSPFSAGGNTFDAGATPGFFWRGRNYNLYHILDRDGHPVADRFDVVDHVSILQSEVRYDDLCLMFGSIQMANQ